MTTLKIKEFVLISVSLMMTLMLVSATLSFGGSPGAKTGSPGDNNDNCTFCHSDNDVITKSDLISSNIPNSGYVPGETYTLTIKASHSGSKRFGFEITAERNSSEKIGTFKLMNEELTQFTNDSSAVTHTFKGTLASDSISWQLNWLAPETGFGDVTFYLAVNATNSDVSSSGDQVYLSNYYVLEEGTTGKKKISLENGSVLIYPNPVKDNLNILLNANKVINNIDIFNIFGKKVKTLNYDKNVKSSIHLELNELSSGIYFVVIKTGHQLITKKIYKL